MRRIRLRRLHVLAVACALMLVGGLLRGGSAAAGLAEECPFDYQGDIDVDGMDLAEFVSELQTGSESPDYMRLLAEEYGRTVCRSCRDYLPCGVRNAHECLKRALSKDSTDANVNLFYAVTRLFGLIHDDQVNALLDDMGIGGLGRVLCNWTADFQRDMETGEIILPGNLPSSQNALDVLIEAFLREIDGAMANLNQVEATLGYPAMTDETFQIALCDELLLPEDLPPCETAEVDYTDVVLYRSMLCAAKAFFLIIDAYDLNVEDTAAMVEVIKNDLFSINRYLCSEGPDCLPSFFTLKDGGGVLLDQAKLAVECAINNYMEASDRLKEETDLQWDDFVHIGPEQDELDDESDFRSLLTDIQSALSGPHTISDPDGDGSFALNLSAFFDGHPDIRGFLPDFDSDDEIVCGTFPDTYFGGIFPEFDDQDDWANLLGLYVPISGEISITTPHTTGSIFVGDCWWRDNVYESCGEDEFTSISSPGEYELFQTAGDDVEISAFWDQDGNHVLSPGDYYGAYPNNPVSVTSENCQGPGDIDVTLSEQAIGIQGVVTLGGEPVGNAWVGVWGCSGDACACSGYPLNGGGMTDEKGYFAITDLQAIPVYLDVSIWRGSSIGWGWWDQDLEALSQQCGDADLVTPSGGETIINISLP